MSVREERAASAGLTRKRQPGLLAAYQAAAQRTGRVLSRREVGLMQSLPIPDLLSHVLDEQALADAMEAKAGDEPSAAEGNAWADPTALYS
jgi:hypothetical protein